MCNIRIIRIGIGTGADLSDDACAFGIFLVLEFDDGATVAFYVYVSMSVLSRVRLCVIVAVSIVMV